MSLWALMLALLIATVSFAEIPTGEIPSSLGVNIHFTDAKAGEMEMIRDGGFRVIRMDFTWSEIEKAKGQYDWSKYDRLVSQLEAAGLKALFILDYNNAFYDSNLSPHTDDGRAGFTKWVADAAKRYKGRGIIWEMWNEPNHPQFWKPAVHVGDYIKLAIATGKAIREAAPGETFVGPATSTIDLPFLEACFEAGLLEYFDAVTVHPYRQSGPETVVDEYRKLRTLIDRYAPQGKQIPIISGEWGYSVAFKGYTPERQGKYLARQWLVNLSCDIPVSIWYDWRDDGTNIEDNEHNFGTVKHKYLGTGAYNVYHPKPAYMAAATLARELAGFRFNKRLAQNSPDDWILLFTNTKGDVRIVAWTAGEPHELQLPMSDGQFDIVTHVGEKSDAITATGGVLKIPLTDSPLYLAPAGDNPFLKVLAAWERLPQFISVDAPATSSPATRIANPLSVPISIQKDGKSVEIAPGEHHTISTSFWVLRTSHALAFDIPLQLQGLGPVRQRAYITCTNPITITPLPAFGGLLPIQLHRPSGDDLTGTLEVITPAGTKSADVTMLPAQKLVTRSAENNAAEKYSVKARLRDDSNQVLHELSRRYELLPLTGYSAVPDGDRQIQSTQSASYGPIPRIDAYQQQPQGLSIKYDFSAGWKFIRIAPREPVAIIGKPVALGMWVYGDGSNNHLRMRFVDSSGQNHQRDIRRLDFTGWEYVEVIVDGESASHWAGKDDGEIHYPIHLDCPLLIDSAERKATSGTVHLALPVLIYH